MSKLERRSKKEEEKGKSRCVLYRRGHLYSTTKHCIYPIFKPIPFHLILIKNGFFPPYTILNVRHIGKKSPERKKKERNK